MTLQDVLKFADKLVLEKTGEHLNDLQQAIIQGVYQGKSYTHIAKERFCSYGHVKDTAYELWNLLSELLGEKIDKFNMGSTLERYTVSKVSSRVNYVLQINNNIGLNTINLENTKKPNDIPTETIKRTENNDLRELPQSSSFYGRTTELNQLKKWINQKKHNLILIYGIKGIGKTSLIIELVNFIKNNFDYVAYYSLKLNPSLENIEQKLLKLVSHCTENNLEVLEETYQENSAQNLIKLIGLVSQHRCLIIFDDVHFLNVFNDQSSQDFNLFFETIAQLDHKSCLILSSSINLRNIYDLSINYSSIQLLQLKNLEPIAAKQLLQDKGMNNDDIIEKLIQIYESHPLWLKQIVNVIQNLLNGDPSLILDNNKTFLTDSMQRELNMIINQLSNREKQILIILANNEKQLSINDICQQSSLSLNEVINGLEKLSDRCLITQQNSYFHVNELIKTYLIQTE